MLFDGHFYQKICADDILTFFVCAFINRTAKGGDIEGMTCSKGLESNPGPLQCVHGAPVLPTELPAYTTLTLFTDPFVCATSACALLHCLIALTVCFVNLS